MKLAAQRAVGRECLQDRPGIGEPAGLDHDAPERRHLAMVALRNEWAQRHLQIGARGAAQASVAEKRDLIAAAAKKRVIDADVAEFIDDDGRAFTFRRGQKTAQERRLSRAEKAGNDGHRNTRAAGLLEPAPEWSRFARGKEIEQPCSLFPLRRHRARTRTTQ